MASFPPIIDEKKEVDQVENTLSLSRSEQDEQDWTLEEERAVVRKADLRVFPMLCVVFGLSLLDRTNISSAYIAGLAEDLHLAIGSRYNIALLIFFVPYALFEIPSNLIIRRLGARYWLSFLITAWGACVLGMGFVHSWQILTVLRALLGLFEAGLFPGAVYIIGSWYRQYETAKRVSVFYMASLLASGFGPIFAYALSLIRVGDGEFRRGWRWIFIIEGIVTVVAGLLAPFFLIEFPEKVKFLTERQKHIATTRVSKEKAGAQTEHPTFRQSMRMLADWKIGMYCIQYFVAASSVYSLAFFFPIVLRQGMGFSYALSQILSSPPYIFTIIASLATAWLSDKIKLRWPILIFHSMTAIVGLLIILYAKPPGMRYFGMFLATFGTQANVPASLAYGQNQTARVQKRGVVAAAMISVGAAGGITGSTIFQSKDAPLYLPGMWATISMQILYSIVTFCMSTYFKRQNRLADEGKKPALEGVEGFRYAP
ncbi:MFS general substrate transporter [Lentithecium fluviatile CBS 122367]|uniref:MFS general substrate transporter n=1 Tax=Lentithecium fluviatile CBS 122367 TaxID=1168545 RepID=A0A6G1IL32_9PLEO|nr:MFS general substrate transporter [Lentithecium fluviatile CBS 122367]